MAALGSHLLMTGISVFTPFIYTLLSTESTTHPLDLIRQVAIVWLLVATYNDSGACAVVSGATLKLAALGVAALLTAYCETLWMNRSPAVDLRRYIFCGRRLLQWLFSC
jgi:hypothetical protein